jgi:methylphosphotriester-DNA--protein-cysteine methyltransferase
MYFRLKETAQLLQCTPQNVRAALKAGRLKGRKDSNGDWEIEYKELMRFIASKSHTVADLAKRLGYHPEYIRRLLRKQTIPGSKNGQWVISDVFFWPGKRNR